MGNVGTIPATGYESSIDQTFSTPTGTTHTLTYSVASQADILVYVNNVPQEPGVGFTVSGTTLTTDTLVSGDTLYVKYLALARQTVTPASDSITNDMVNSGAGIATTKLGAGALVQVVNTTTGAVATGTAVVPIDDTIPQITEGDEYLSLAITPKSTSNKLFVQVVVNLAHSVAATQYIGGIFNTDVHSTNAGACVVGFPSNTGTYKATQLVINYYLTAPTTSSTTFTFRAGGHQAGTLVLNGGFGGATRKLGGAYASGMTIMEIAV